MLKTCLETETFQTETTTMMHAVNVIVNYCKFMGTTFFCVPTVISALHRLTVKGRENPIFECLLNMQLITAKTYVHSNTLNTYN